MTEYCNVDLIQVLTIQRIENRSFFTLSGPRVFCSFGDVLSRQFVSYSRFDLSESDSCDLELPQPDSDSKVHVEMSPIWRVEILKPDEFTVEQFVFPP